ncbi:MAG: addiction module protein [Verrucomicrobiales bacterium]|nr:addiction module protein [Verrucomicrobiales bacterium]
MTSVLEIMDHVLKLPRTDRGYLAQKLIESLDEDTELSDAEKEVLDRRSRELKDGSRQRPEPRTTKGKSQIQSG